MTDTRAQGAILDAVETLGYRVLPVENLPGPWDITPCPGCGRGTAFVGVDGALSCRDCP